MSANPLAVISTRLTPGACGIGAHSVLLRKHWPGGETPVDFIVVEGAHDTDVLPTGDRVVEFRADGARLARELERIGRADLLLHYAGRAYHRFGFPIWMPALLKRWKQRFHGARLMVLFHEVPGDDLPITSRHFWFGQLNLRIIRQLGRLADVLVTNTEAHAARLRKVCARPDVHLLPIPSNIELVPGEQRARAATEFVVFGLSFGRLEVMRAFDAHIRQWHSAGNLSRLHLIGPAGDNFSAEADEMMTTWPASIEVVKHGMLPATEVSRLLQTARYALTNVTGDTWSKSSTFMACATHRCAVVIATQPSASPPLSYAVPAAELASIADAEIERRTAALAQWAAQNASWPVIATRMAALLEQRNGNGG